MGHFLAPNGPKSWKKRGKEGVCATPSMQRGSHADPAFSARVYTGRMDDGLGKADFLDEVIPVEKWATDGQPNTHKRPQTDAPSNGEKRPSDAITSNSRK